MALVIFDMSGILYIVPTPIGNLDDMSFRAVETLKKCHTILAEDTRTSGKLLKHFGINTPLKSYHMHNEHRLTEEFVNSIENGEDLALISDAGTPGISDPGYLIISQCIEKNIEVICLPGATAFVPALVTSGFPIQSFIYFGFLPAKKGRKKKLEEVLNQDHTAVLYESPHRILKLATEIASSEPLRRVAISREISKKFEETLRGTAEEITKRLENHPIKGEIVVVIEKKHAKV